MDLINSLPPLALLICLATSWAGLFGVARHNFVLSRTLIAQQKKIEDFANFYSWSFGKIAEQNPKMDPSVQLELEMKLAQLEVKHA